MTRAEAIARYNARQEEEARLKRYAEEKAFALTGQALEEEVDALGVARAAITLGECPDGEQDEETAVAMQLSFRERGRSRGGTEYLTFSAPGVPKERYAVAAGAEVAVVIELAGSAPETRVTVTRADGLKSLIRAYDARGQAVPAGVQAVFRLKVEYAGKNASALVGATNLYCGLFD